MLVDQCTAAKAGEIFCVVKKHYPSFPFCALMLYYAVELCLMGKYLPNQRTHEL